MVEQEIHGLIGEVGLHRFHVWVFEIILAQRSLLGGGGAGDSSSSHKNVNLPQGSVLGILLFLFYINNLIIVRFIDRVIAFPDNVKLNHDPHHIKELVFLSSSYNYNKTKFIIFRSRRVTLEYCSIVYHVPNCFK